MNLLLVLGRVLLGGILIVAGAAKLANRVETRHALRSFGTPDRLVPALSWFLPVAELLCGAGVMVPATARWGAVGALGLLIVFLAAIAWNLMRGRRPDCRCFGHLHSAPIGWRMVTRNLALGTVAGLIVLQPERAAGLPYPSWSLTVGESVAVGLAVASCALAAAAVWLLLGLLKQHGRLLLRLDALEARLSAETPTPHRTGESDAASSRFGLPVGADAPPFALPDLDGRTVSLDELRARGRTLLLLFMDPGCGPCRSLLPEVASWRREQQGRLTVVMVSRGDAGANRSKFELSDIEILLQADDEIAERYQALATPSAVVVDVRGKVASPVAQGAAAIRQLAARATEPPAPARKGRRAAPAPAAVGVGLLAMVTLLTAASVPLESGEDRRGGGWSLEVHDGAGWRTWWRSDSAPDAWRGPVQAVLDATNWTPIARGADLGEVVVSGGGRGLRTRLVLGRFDPRYFRVVLAVPRAPAAPGRPAWTIDSAGAAAVFAFNAGQFAGGRAWGWLVRDGRELQAPGSGPLSMAVAVMHSGEHRFLSPDSLIAERASGIHAAFQSFPALLVGDGDVHPLLRALKGPVDLTHRDARLALCLLRDGRVLVALTRFDNLGRIFGALPIGLTLPEQAAVMGALGCQRAVSLDGGLSAQLLARPRGQPALRWAGNRAVPLGIEVVPLP